MQRQKIGNKYAKSRVHEVLWFHREFWGVFTEVEPFKPGPKGQVKCVMSQVGVSVSGVGNCAQRQEGGKVHNSVCLEPRIWRAWSGKMRQEREIPVIYLKVTNPRAWSMGMRVLRVKWGEWFCDSGQCIKPQLLSHVAVPQLLPERPPLKSRIPASSSLFTTFQAFSPCSLALIIPLQKVFDLMNLPIPSPRSHTLISFLRSLLALFPHFDSWICHHYLSGKCSYLPGQFCWVPPPFTVRDPDTAILWPCSSGSDNQVGLRITSLCQTLSTAWGPLVTCSLKQLSPNLIHILQISPSYSAVDFSGIAKTCAHQIKTPSSCGFLKMKIASPPPW